jgi:hypothetical protein
VAHRQGFSSSVTHVASCRKCAEPLKLVELSRQPLNLNTGTVGRVLVIEKAAFLSFLERHYRQTLMRAVSYHIGTVSNDRR